MHAYCDILPHGVKRHALLNAIFIMANERELGVIFGPTVTTD